VKGVRVELKARDIRVGNQDPRTRVRRRDPLKTDHDFNVLPLEFMSSQIPVKERRDNRRIHRPVARLLEVLRGVTG
jgi:hypothetical protein